jgi:membrane protein implicated in regulation of membrane protease activity
VTLTFLAIGGLSLLLLALSLRFHRTSRLRFLSRLPLRHRPGRRRGSRNRSYTLPVTSGFIGGFGFGGAIAVELSHRTGSAAVVLGCLVGLAVGLPFAWAAGRFVAAVADMPTDATPQSADLVGSTGLIVSEVPAGGLGQVRLSYAGQPMKFNARADGPLALGVRVVVIGVPTPTCVLVTPLDAMLITEEGP